MQYISYENLNVDDITFGQYETKIYTDCNRNTHNFELLKIFHKNKNLMIEGCEVECRFIEKNEYLRMEYNKDDDCKYINKINELDEKINKENNNITRINKFLVDSINNTKKNVEHLKLSQLISICDINGNPIDISILENRKFMCIPVVEYIDIFKSRNKCSIRKKIRSILILSISGGLDESIISFIKNSINYIKDNINEIIKYCEDNVDYIPIVIESLISYVKYHEILYSISKHYMDYYNKLDITHKKIYIEYYKMVNYHCAHIIIGTGELNMEEKRNVLSHLYEADNYLNSNILRTKLFFTYYLGYSLRQCQDNTIDINITSETILNLGELIYKLNGKNKYKNKMD